MIKHNKVITNKQMSTNNHASTNNHPIIYYRMIICKNSICKLFILGIVMTAMFFLLHFLTFFNAKNEWKEFKSILKGKERIIDLARDKEKAYAIVSKEGRHDYGDIFVVFNLKDDNGWERIYENDFTGLKPWKIALADVDGDGALDILTAVRKSTYYDKKESNRLFVFNYKNNILVKKWTGSKIAGNWRTFYVGDFLGINGDELIFVEKEADGRERLSIYYWFDFGFIRLAESEAFENIMNVSVLSNNLLAVEYGTGKDMQKRVLSVRDGKLLDAVDE